MNVVKKLLLGILSPLFIILLFATAFDIGFIRTATHPATVKKLVTESGIYDSVVPSLLRQQKTIDTNFGSFSASDPAIQKAANQAVPPQEIKQSVDGAIDNVYQWLDGQVAQPTFKIDLTGANSGFAGSVADIVQQKLANLPACTTAQSIAIAQSGQFDAVNTTCLPRDITAASAAALVKSSLANGQGFLGKTTLSADSFKGSSNQSFFETDKAKQVPKQYQRAKKTPLILSVLTILTGVGIVFLSSTWQKGLRHIGINLVVIGIVMLVFSYALNRVVSTKVVPKIKVDNAVLQTDVRNLATDLTQQIDKNYWFFGGLYTVLGAGGIVAAQVFHRRARLVTAANIKSTPVSGGTDEPKPAKRP
jgi:hypothetical protein